MYASILYTWSLDLGHNNDFTTIYGEVAMVELYFRIYFQISFLSFGIL